jgi:ubiquinone/menaquinone biosynthesis C-methylase UbiE
MSSVSFDPIAHLYDATRGYPDNAAQQIALAIEKAAYATPSTTFFEVGIGTGRIAAPLTSLGHIYTGIDISEKMLAELKKKLLIHSWQEDIRPWGAFPDENTSLTPHVQRFSHPASHASMRLVLSDMTQLPFHNASFDVVIAVHVFHLVPDWQQAVNEVLRVLRPGGILLHCWDEDARADVQLIGEQWRKFLHKLGGETTRPGTSSPTVVADWLSTLGLQSELLYPFSWTLMVSPRQVIENITRRYWSGTWSIPDAIFIPATERLWQWAHTYYGSELDIPRQQLRRFVISRTEV